MTWHTPMGERTLLGAEAALYREALASVADMVDEDIQYDEDPWEFGVSLFDQLKPLAKLALLAEVGWALFRDTESCPILTALNEATIAVLFRHIEQSIQDEILNQDVSEDPLFWRTRVLAIFHEEDDTEGLPMPGSEDWGEWSILTETLYDRILWDADFDDADRFLDASPDQAGFVRYILTIDDEYYRAIPPDPQDSDLPQIRATIRESLSVPSG